MGLECSHGFTDNTWCPHCRLIRRQHEEPLEAQRLGKEAKRAIDAAAERDRLIAEAEKEGRIAAHEMEHDDRRVQTFREESPRLKGMSKNWRTVCTVTRNLGMGPLNCGLPGCYDGKILPNERFVQWLENAYHVKCMISMCDSLKFKLFDASGKEVVDWDAKLQAKAQRMVDLAKRSVPQRSGPLRRSHKK